MATSTHGTRIRRSRTETQYEALRKLLRREQQLLQARRWALLRQNTSREPQETTDVEERSEEQVDFAVSLAALSLTARTVQSTEAALRRFEAGTYGRCLDCRGSVEPGRLRAMPFAELCRGCQERHDGSRGERVDAV